MPVRRYDSAVVDVAPLGQPLKFEFSGKVAKNRFYKASMAEDLASWSVENFEERGIPTKELIELYRIWGENEWGIIATGNIDIEFDMLDLVGDGIITPECPFSGPRFEAFQEMAKVSKANGSLIVAQVTHPGRQLAARIRKDTISASAIQHPPKNGAEYARPREATKEDIARVIDGFAHAAEYLDKAGFDGIQLHGAHGYLIAQFLSELSNQRTDEYGGSISSRLRLVSEIAREVKRRVRPDFIVGIKVNSVEFQEKGIKPAEARIMCETFQELEFDYVELSGGNHEEIGYGSKKETTLKREAYFLEFVRDIVPHLSRTKKFLTGGFRTTAAMVDALAILDGIGIARPAAQEPRLARDILSGKVTSAIRPVDGIVNDVMLSANTAGSQMAQIVRGQEPFDLSDEKAVESYKADLGTHFQKFAAANGSLEFHGFPELSSPNITSHPYGVPY
ncbi:NADH:flavin oxidoreductase/NADH oxidase-like protein [Daldinia decipiens]|uniref:NADH:flavin oxidoreductase/NADH oxidase-like protein n=1 Tax=Daldinia decipiens TaxID=326647 RepID=UPI0020C353CD|nr:NADH:flavin oxidoreductase/NADH oxidase-like protein [Daldinia decipiens]KAI1657220.1 NADH:flavin oxidoreductase/NADH oxidase-like protein [Daldinia decipiens]